MQPLCQLPLTQSSTHPSISLPLPPPFFPPSPSSPLPPLPLSLRTIGSTFSSMQRDTISSVGHAQHKIKLWERSLYKVNWVYLHVSIVAPLYSPLFPLPSSSPWSQRWWCRWRSLPSWQSSAVYQWGMLVGRRTLRSRTQREYLGE